MKNRTVSSLI